MKKPLKQHRHAGVLDAQVRVARDLGPVVHKPQYILDGKRLVGPVMAMKLKGAPGGEAGGRVGARLPVPAPQRRWDDKPNSLNETLEGVTWVAGVGLAQSRHGARDGSVRARVNPPKGSRAVPPNSARVSPAESGAGPGTG
uniref:Uncharacterized protein n=1 Tax=Human herpesvirus 1 TaxID=10298 RepID=A0A2Z4H854_HHV1|nr:hypothetical protein [Human alphaherpesvirus 1]